MSDSENLTPRQLRAAERIQEDEGLTGDLEDAQASQLVHWAGEAAVRAAAPELSDAQSDELLAAVRKAARQAARQAAEEGQDVLALAEAALAKLAPPAQEPPPAAEPQPPAAEPQPPAAQPLTFRRRIESLRTRLISLISHRTN